jgi:DNA-binding MarR family transcriptional regulator
MSTVRDTGLDTGLDPVRMAAWRAFISAATRSTAQLTQELQDETGMPLSWYEVLVHLSEAADRRLRMQELADRVLLSQSGLTRLVDRLQSEGLVERERCPSDGRGTFAALTEQGFAALERAYPTHLRGVRSVFADLLSDEEATQLAEVLARVADAARPAAQCDGAG